MIPKITAFASGVLFAIGLGVGGMNRPEKIIGFLDVANWDPALLFVMAGAMMTYMVLFRVVTKRPSPLTHARFEIPTRREISGRLIVGSTLFGVGWALAGFCPGPAIVSLATGSTSVLTFVVAMGAGMYAYRHVDAWLAAREQAARAGAGSKAWADA